MKRFTNYLTERSGEISSIHQFMSSLIESDELIDTLDIIHRYMESIGRQFNELGTYSRVYKGTKGGRNVVKVSATDPLFAEYARIVHTDKMWERNPTFPKIEHVYTFHEGEIVVVVMEELAVGQPVFDLFTELTEDSEGHEEISMLEISQNLVEYIAYGRKPLRATLVFLKNLERKGGNGTVQNLEKNMRWVYREFGGLDFHQHNVGLRGDMLVFFDPIASA
jgi:hypothetical protein